MEAGTVSAGVDPYLEGAAVLLLEILPRLLIAHQPVIVTTGLTFLVLQLVERRGGNRHIDVRQRVDLSTLLDSVPDAVFLFDDRACVVDLNGLAEELCGRSREQLHNISITSLNRLLAARDEFDRPVDTPSMGVNRALCGEVVSNLRRVFRNAADGRTIETLTSASPIRDTEGRTQGAILLVRDVTEVSLLQRRLADAQRHKEVGEMAAGLAHDFSNVLDAITQAAMVVDISSNAAERHDYTEMIRRAVDRGAEIIERVRDYLRAGSGPQAETDVLQVVRDVLDLTRPLWYGRRNVKIKTDLQPVPLVSANAADLRRVFTNFVINALEAMPEGGELTLRCEPVGNRVRVRISDTGQGIPPEQQKKLFVPYFTTKPQGTGLGLSGARRIIDSLHGQISCWSQVGKGTTFVIELPANASAGGRDSKVAHLRRRGHNPPTDQSKTPRAA